MRANQPVRTQAYHAQRRAPGLEIIEPGFRGLQRLGGYTTRRRAVGALFVDGAAGLSVVHECAGEMDHLAHAGSRCVCIQVLRGLQDFAARCRGVARGGRQVNHRVHTLQHAPKLWRAQVEEHLHEALVLESGRMLIHA